jgi:hypothetical protein
MDLGKSCSMVLAIIPSLGALAVRWPKLIQKLIQKSDQRGGLEKQSLSKGERLVDD